MPTLFSPSQAERGSKTEPRGAFHGPDRRLDQISRYDAREFKTALSKGELAKLNQGVFETTSPRTV